MKEARYADTLFSRLSRDEKKLVHEISKQEITTREELAPRFPWGGSKLNGCLASLRGQGVLSVTAGEKDGSGRKPHAYALRSGLGFFLGLHCDIPGDNLVLLDFNGRVIHEKGYATKSYADNAVEAFLRNVEDFFSGLPELNKNILAAGISTAIQFNKPGSKSFRSPSYANDAVAPLKNALEARFRFPIYMGRPQVLICYRKYKSSLINSRKSFINIIVTDNVGIAVFINGESYLGHSGLSGDLGHIKVPGNTLPCYCGSTGCLRTLISYMGICGETRNRIEKILESGGTSPFDIKDFEGPDYEKGVKILVTKAAEHDPLATNIIYSTATHLGNILATVVSLFNPEYLIIHSILTRAEEIFTDRIKTIIRKNCLELYSLPLHIEMTAYTQFSIAEGTAVYARDKYFMQTLKDN
jgi:predicted NBD/HSP70 family sugar kinase